MRPTGISYRLWWRHNDITMTSSINNSRRAVRTIISVWYYWTFGTLTNIYKRTFQFGSLNIPLMSIRAQFIGRRFFVVIRGYTRSNAVQLLYAIVRGWTWLDAVEHGSRLILENKKWFWNRNVFKHFGIGKTFERLDWYCGRVPVVHNIRKCNDLTISLLR